MNSFHFLRPYWLLALIPFAWLCWRNFKTVRMGGGWMRICDDALLPHIIDSVGEFKSVRYVSLLFAWGGILAILALAGPVWQRLPMPVFRSDAALVIALNLSKSMDAKDIKPSRLDRARFKIEDLLKLRKDGLTALLVYSGDAFSVTPLTDDVETIKSQLKSLTTDLMPIPGNRTDLALLQAKRLLEQSGLTRGDVLLITDSIGASINQKSSGFRLSILGAGTEAGAPIPLAQGGFLVDDQGNIIVSKLATEPLSRLANQGGGIYKNMSADSSDLSALIDWFERSAKQAAIDTEDNPLIEQWQEFGPYLLLMLLPIAAFSFRRGYLIVGLILFLPVAKPAHAFDWPSLWQSPDQKGLNYFKKGDMQAAANTFSRSDWKAVAEYKAGQYEASAKSLENVNSADAHYNRGNALAQLNRYPEAIASYEQALKLEPHHEDAIYNKAIVEKMMQDQPKEPKQENKQQDQEQERDQQQPDDKGDQDQSKDQKDQKDQNDQKDKPDEAEKPKDKMDERSIKKTPDETNRADEQWLRRIPDDPGGLLRRKFLYQYNQRQRERP